jgi:hypothetical protein
MQRIAISLAGHTNLGKTTLARTLLRRDIGVVDDRPHVTDIADGHVMAKDEQAEVVLWDLPGFGDSVRLKQRLRRTGIVAWLLGTFDRWADRPLWCSQQCLLNAKNDADVVLYLLDAQADPAGSPEVRAEMEILGCIGKPVFLLLNQTGLPDDKRDRVLVQGWRDALAEFPFVRDAMPLDGWMRCWVQESLLFQRIAPLLTDEKRPHFERLVSSWKQVHHDAVFTNTIHLLAKALAATATDRAVVEKELLVEQAVALATRKPTPQNERARAALTASLVERSHQTMVQLLAAHGLEGVPRDRVESMVDGLRARDPDAPPEVWAILGGIGSGVIGGLIADVHAGGLSFGGGTVAGAFIGGLAAYALGYGYQKMKGDDGVNRLQWSEKFLLDEWQASALRYLMIAHVGRGQGRWEEPIPSAWPAQWKKFIDDWTANHRKEISAALAASELDAIQALMESQLREILNHLYPNSRDPEES